MSRIRRAGMRWRLLVHEWTGTDASREATYGTAHHVTNNRRFGGASPDGEFSTTHELPAHTEFDELVVDSWLHVENMDTGTWWMNIAGVTLWVRADRDGRPTEVSVYLPGQYAEPVPGVTYRDGHGLIEVSSRG